MWLGGSNSSASGVLRVRAKHVITGAPRSNRLPYPTRERGERNETTRAPQPSTSSGSSIRVDGYSAADSCNRGSDLLRVFFFSTRRSRAIELGGTSRDRTFPGDPT